GPEDISGPPIFGCVQQGPVGEPWVPHVPQWILATFCVFHIRTNDSLLFCTFMIRHGRPTTLWSVFENVIGPEIVGRPRKFSNAAASLAPVVSPPVFFSAAASASIVA